MKRILIVDDEYNWRKMIVDVLEAKGYEVDDTDTINEAIELMAIQPYDIVINDLRIDRSYSDGTELIREIEAKYPTTNLIIFSAYGNNLHSSDFKNTKMNFTVLSKQNIDQLFLAIE